MSKAPTSAVRFAVALAATAVMALVVTSSAFGAGEVTKSGGSLTFVAEQAKVNHVTVVASPKSVTISDSGDTITTVAAGCLGSGPNTVICTAGGEDFFGVRIELEEFPEANNDTANVSGSINISVSGGGGEDTLGSSATVRAELSGDAGNDLLTGGPGDDSLLGGAGIDVLNGNGGHDVLQGGEGAGDTVNGGDASDVFALTSAGGGNDRLNGGAGLDTILYLTLGAEAPSYAVDLNAGTASGNGETDFLNSIEDATTFQGSDTVTGSAGGNRLITDLEEDPILGAVSGVGATVGADQGDTVNPLGGADSVRTGGGNDIVNLVDGYADQLDCGVGTDVVQADQLDELIDCEVVTRTTVAPFGSLPVDTAAPDCKLSGIKASYSRSEFLKGPRVTVQCNEIVSLEARLTAPATAKAQKGKRGQGRGSATTSRAGDLVLAESSISSATSATLKLKPAGRLKSQVGSSFKATLRVVGRDPNGNAIVIERSIQVKPDAKKAKRKKK